MLDLFHNAHVRWQIASDAHMTAWQNNIDARLAGRLRPHSAAELGALKGVVADLFAKMMEVITMQTVIATGRLSSK